MPRGHPAYTQRGGDFLLRWNQLTRFQFTGANLFAQPLLNLVVQRHHTLPIENHRTHSLYLYRRLDIYNSSTALSSKSIPSSPFGAAGNTQTDGVNFLHLGRAVWINGHSGCIGNLVEHMK